MEISQKLLSAAEGITGNLDRDSEALSEILEFFKDVSPSDRKKLSQTFGNLSRILGIDLLFEGRYEKSRPQQKTRQASDATQEEEEEWNTLSERLNLKSPKQLSNESRLKANAEGWDIFLRSDGEVELCRIDSPQEWAEDNGVPFVAKLPSDIEAWIIALTGLEKHHIEAQSLMERLAPVELQRMRNHVQDSLRDRTNVMFCSADEDYIDVDVYFKQPDGSEFLQRFYVNKSSPQDLIRDAARYAKSETSHFDDGDVVRCPAYVKAAFELATPKAMEIIKSRLDENVSLRGRNEYQYG
jgi:hypothetical protein